MSRNLYITVLVLLVVIFSQGETHHLPVSWRSTRDIKATNTTSETNTSISSPPSEPPPVSSSSTTTTTTANDDDKNTSSLEADDEDVVIVSEGKARIDAIQKFRHGNEYQSLMFTLVRRYPNLNMTDIITTLETVIPRSSLVELTDKNLPYILLKKVRDMVGNNSTAKEDEDYREYFKTVNDLLNGPGWIVFSKEVSTRLGPEYKDRQKELAEVLVLVITRASVEELKEENAVQNLLDKIESEMNIRLLVTTETVTE